MIDSASGDISEKEDERSISSFANFQQCSAPNIKRRIVRVTTIQESEVFYEEKKKKKRYLKVASYSKSLVKDFPKNIEINSENYKYR